MDPGELGNPPLSTVLTHKQIQDLQSAFTGIISPNDGLLDTIRNLNSVMRSADLQPQINALEELYRNLPRPTLGQALNSIPDLSMESVTAHMPHASRDTNVGEVIDFLQQLRDALPDKGTPAYVPGQFTRVDKVLVPLLVSLRSMPPQADPHEPPVGFASGEFDILLQDVQEEDLLSIHKDLSDVQSPDDPRTIAGIMYGRHRRVFFRLPVASVKEPQHVTLVDFLFDTGAPATSLTPKTWEALGIETSSGARILVNGIKTFASISTRHFSNINLLGHDWTGAAEVRITLNYQKDEVRLAMPPHPVATSDDN